MANSAPSIKSMGDLISALNQATAAQRDMLRVLERMGRFATISEISQATHLHPNSARESLDVLVDLGLVTKKAKPSASRGRPAWVYEAAAPGSLQGLHNHISDFVTAAVELYILSAANPQAEAEKLGTYWADLFLARTDAPDHSKYPRLQTQDQISIHASKIRVFLSGQGFQAIPGEELGTLEIISCPFNTTSEEVLHYIRVIHSAMLNRIVQVMSRGAVRVDFTPGTQGEFALVKLSVINSSS